MSVAVFAGVLRAVPVGEILSLLCVRLLKFAELVLGYFEGSVVSIAIPNSCTKLYENGRWILKLERHLSSKPKPPETDALSACLTSPPASIWLANLL